MLRGPWRVTRVSLGYCLWSLGGIAQGIDELRTAKIVVVARDHDAIIRFRDGRNDHVES